MNAPQATIWGNVTRDPELRYTADNGTPWTTLRVATNTHRRNQEPETLFWDVTLWRHTAEYAARNVRTGMGVYAQGDFSLRSYTRDDGTLVTVPCISSSDFEIATRGAPAAENWLQNRPSRTSDGGNPTDAAQDAATQQQEDNGARRSGQLEPRQPQRQPQPDRPPTQNRARPQPPTQTRPPQATPAAEGPPYEPPEEPAYTPQFYDED